MNITHTMFIAKNINYRLTLSMKRVNTMDAVNKTIPTTSAALKALMLTSQKIDVV